MTSLSELTTLRLGGPAGSLVECRDEDSIVAAVREADAAGRPLLVLGGGSNVVVADEGFPGAVLRVLSSGIAWRVDGSRVVLSVQAGETWDDLVARCVEEELAGVECLSGIPGLVGATPIQNVGAYGQEVSDTILRVRVYDRASGEAYDMMPEDCGFSYRSSVFKRAPERWVVLGVTFALERRRESMPVRYAELARALGVEVGARLPLEAVREAVLRLRRAKGMVLDGDDPDTVSAGSFFLNPVLDCREFERLEGRVRERFGPDVRPPAFPAGTGQVKTSAAWLISHAGFWPGYGDPEGIAISTKHTLALTNRGRGTTAQLVTVAREIASAVRRHFGVELVPEPVLVGPVLSRFRGADATLPAR